MKEKIMDEQVLKSFGLHPKAIRQNLKISQENLAAKADLDRTYISGIERGLRNVSLLNIVRLANALDVSPSALLSFQMD